MTPRKRAKCTKRRLLLILIRKWTCTMITRTRKKADKKAEEDTKKAIYTDCSWVASHFESRREKRKNEIAGLEDARAFLAGASGDVAPEAVDAGLSDELLK